VAKTIHVTLVIERIEKVPQSGKPIKESTENTTGIILSIKDNFGAYCCQPSSQFLTGPLLRVLLLLSQQEFSEECPFFTLTTSWISFLRKHVLTPNRPCCHCCNNTTEGWNKLVTGRQEVDTVKLIPRNVF
jgi:hypothetical protein